MSASDPANNNDNKHDSETKPIYNRQRRRKRNSYSKVFLQIPKKPPKNLSRSNQSCGSNRPNEIETYPHCSNLYNTQMSGIQCA
ncbi:unnamed protein product [Rhizophagus irregularis]|uniref:Uncharacterized protein n=1 Tax=Rhizophagus irregularis TaxID=588596 RepID=A0A2I1GP17_9GLOM|nr:hypothetical protein RhiirA4_463967 [Rhizophagus irregularis]CAB4408013.1 unnamed protein product [Rhizophagus irregularis]CAB4408547.1 unnamed protein product [Rhizophagus irregularis]